MIKAEGPCISIYQKQINNQRLLYLQAINHTYKYCFIASSLLIFALFPMGTIWNCTKESKQTDPKTLNVISLNYSGILINPFQFYEGQNQSTMQQQEKLSQKFQTLLKQYCEQNLNKPYEKYKFKWNLGQIDKKFQKDRYSPLYNRNVGIFNKRLVDEKVFRQLWQETYHQNVDKIFKSSSGQKQKKQDKNNKLPTKEEAAQAQTFDWLCFLAIVQHLYGNIQPEQAENNNKYEQFMHKMFSKPLLNQTTKLKMTINAFEKQQIDIAFIQESNQNQTNYQQKDQKRIIYSTDKKQSIIVVKSQKGKTKFKKFDNQNMFKTLFNNQQQQKYNWNQDTMYAKVDKLILICAHLSSKQQKNSLQRQHMKSYLKKLRGMYPDSSIILGTDANSFLSFNGQNFCQFPDNIEQVTTRKKRTFLQPQVKKA